MTQITVAERKSFQSFDGHKIGYLDIGAGPIVLLLHGLTANAELNFVVPGIIDRLLAEKYRVIAPDLRGHGASSIQNTAKNWPHDAMARDQIALLKHLDAEPKAIVGYSMGAIVTLRLHLISRYGAKLVLAGMGHTVALEETAERHELVVGAVNEAVSGKDAPSAEFIRAAIAASGSTPQSVAGSLRERMFVPPDLLQSFKIPVLVLNGDEDQDNGSGEGLAAHIPGARLQLVAGTHMSAVNNPDLADALVAFLAEP